MTTCSASPARSRPVSTKTQVSCVADGFVDQDRGDRRIDPARQAADHLPVADLRADGGDLGGAEAGHAPCRGAPGDVPHEVGDQLGAVGRVDHLGVELDAVVTARLVGDGGERRTVADRDRREAGRQVGDQVAVAHPHLVALAGCPDAVEQAARGGHLDEGAAELAAVAREHPAAELFGEQLLAVADAEDGNVAVEQRLRGARAAGVAHRGGAARQDDAAGLEARDGGLGRLERHDLAIDSGLADTAGDQLGDLAAEVEDEDRFGGRDGFHGCGYPLAAPVSRSTRR